MKTLPIRLNPGQDLRAAIEAAVRGQNCRAAFVLSGIGSLSTAGLRFAGAEQVKRIEGDTEILSLSGTVAFDGERSSSHLHMALSTATGEVLGGHVVAGCVVRTTAEVLLALLPEWAFSREVDAGTGYEELVVRERGGGSGDGSRIESGMTRQNRDDNLFIRRLSLWQRAKRRMTNLLRN
jgi:predicted DNA-binding protein with PD1-like motif